MRKVLAGVLAALATTGFAVAAAPARAADTLVTLPVGVAVEALAIAAPAAIVTPGSPATATIASAVTDTRLSGSGWTVSISATALTLTGATSPGTAGTIPANTITAYTGTVLPDVLGTVTIASPYTSAAPLTLSGVPQSFVTATNRTNVNTAAYTATLRIPTAGKTTGVYTGTVTQSVA